MSFSNYTELQTEIANWLNRDDLTASIPDFIKLCETHLNNDLHLVEMIKEATISPSQAVRYVALPDGFNELVSFTDDSGEKLTELTYQDLELNAYNSYGSPGYYAITDQINFECVASGALNYKMKYFKRLDLATDETNSVLTKYPNIYLFGSLLMGAIRTKDKSMIGEYQALYDSALKGANKRSKQNLKILMPDPSGVGRYDITRGF